MSSADNKSAIVPYLCVNGAEKAIEFYATVFGAKELMRYQDEPGGRIGHVTLEINGAEFFMADEFPEINVLSPETLGGSPVTLHILVPNVDEVARLASEAGATLTREPADQGYGERNCKFTDPFGHVWMVATPI